MVLIALIVIVCEGCSFLRPVIIDNRRVPYSWTDNTKLDPTQGNYINFTDEQKKICMPYMYDYLTARGKLLLANEEFKQIKGLSYHDSI